MKFDLTTNPIKGFENQPVSYHQKNDSVKISVRQAYCAECEEPVDFGLFHQLEHEMVECICNKIRWDDGDYNINTHGFDMMALEWHEHIVRHICGNSVVMHWSA